ncbi:MAG: orotidine-5'-phosphate decarboxylase [Ignavibacteria bacterium]|nr:orotidine-5'-phosphate decarboxylase [Ignavibacteria bacterium]
MKANQKLQNRIDKGYHICVGLDTDLNKLPENIKKTKNPLLEFNKRIIENTYDIAASYKLNLAFYEAEGIPGMECLQETLALIPTEILTIGDAKRGDIGNTSQMYAKSLFDHFGFDASTLNPYMGYDSVEPFLEYENKLNFILALTSNKSNKDIEKLVLHDGRFVFQKVIEKVKYWNKQKNCGLVFGATNSSELEENVNSFGKMPVLLPGVGAQGGSLEEVVKIFNRSENNSFIINVSRGIIYADSTEQFGKTARKKLVELNNEIEQLKK